MIDYRSRGTRYCVCQGAYKFLVINSEVAFDGNAYVCIEFFLKKNSKVTRHVFLLDEFQILSVTVIFVAVMSWKWWRGMILCDRVRERESMSGNLHVFQALLFVFGFPSSNCLTHYRHTYFIYKTA